ncbi:hypothetical protein JCM10212_004219 [Sporobolomyces blumeae]
MTDHRRDEEQPLLGDPALRDNADPPSFSTRVRTALHHPTRLNGLERILAVSAILFFLLTATFTGLYAGEAVKLGRERGKHHSGGGRHAPTTTVTATSTVPGPTVTAVPPPQPTKQPGKDELCFTADCVKSAANLLSNLDTTVDPCEDFYTFANGGWLANHPIPQGQGSYGTFQEITDRNKRIISTILDAPIDKSLPSADQKNLHNLKNFWSSCTSEAALDKKGPEPLLEIVETVIDTWRGETVEPEFTIQGGSYEIDFKHKKKKKGSHKGRKWDPKTTRERLTNALTFLHSRGVGALFSSYPEGDVAKNPKFEVLWMSQGGLGLPSKDYYKDKDSVKAYESTVETVLGEIYDARHERDMIAWDLAQGVVKFEKELAKISLDVVDVEDPIGTYNPYNSSALQSLFPSISFRDYFASFTPRPRYPDPVIVATPTFFSNLTHVLSKTAPDVLEAYFVFQLSQNYGELLGPKEPIRKALTALSNGLIGVPADAERPRSDVCLDLLSENYGFLIGRYFVQQAFPGSSKEYAEEVIESLLEAYKTRLPDLGWLDDETRSRAREKVEAITHKIGYPSANPNTDDPDSVQRYYSINEPIAADDFFGNIVRSQIADQRRAWVKVGRERGPEFDMYPSEVNAYYNPSENVIVFPAGILQKPFFAVDWPEYLVFGSIGSVAGHEVGHSLDQAGRLYDKDGKLVDWWTNETNHRFEERQQCFIKQYSEYYVIGPDGRKYHVNSKFTDGEDTADAGGVTQAWRAWKARMESDGDGHKYKNFLLPGLGEYTREQLFFIAYAQGWARAVTPAEAQRRIRIDPHSPTNFRVRGPLSNNEEFAKAFNCPVGLPMNNEHKCQVRPVPHPLTRPLD